MLFSTTCKSIHYSTRDFGLKTSEQPIKFLTNCLQTQGASNLDRHSSHILNLSHFNRSWSWNFILTEKGRFLLKVVIEIIIEKVIIVHDYWVVWAVDFWMVEVTVCKTFLRYWLLFFHLGEFTVGWWPLQTEEKITNIEQTCQRDNTILAFR